MNRDVARKRPAEVVQTSVIRMRTEVQEGRDRWALFADVAAQERRGYVRRLSQAPVWNFSMGVWEMRVVRLKQPPATWVQIVRPVLLVVVPLAAFVAAACWFLMSLTATSLAGLCVVALAGLAALVKMSVGRGSITVEQIQRVTIRR